MTESHVNIIKEFSSFLKINNAEWKILKEKLLPKLFSTNYSSNKNGLKDLERDINIFLDDNYIFIAQHIEIYEKEAKKNYLKLFIMGIIMGFKIK